MHIAEIIILIVGAVLFTVSFFMSDKGGSKLDEEEERKQIRELLEKEVGTAKFQIEEAAEDCISDNKDRMERALDRITNEKMNAVNDYSNTVLEQIHKNHDEVMFLYDMLNNKHTQVKNTAAELNQITKSAKVAAGNLENAAMVGGVENTAIVTGNIEAAEITTVKGVNSQAAALSDAGAINKEKNAVRVEKSASNSAAKTAPKNGIPNLSKPEDIHKNNSEKGFGYVSPGKNTSEGQGFGYTKSSAKEEVFESIFEEIPVKELDVVEVNADEQKPAPKKKAPKAKVEKIPVIDSNIDLMFASDNNTANNNDKILALHKEGKSNMAIAKELGLGIGEVKLVIDLFEGI